MLFCVGAFFADDTPAGALPRALPLPAYVLGPASAAQAAHYAGVPLGGDLCENVTYLGACVLVWREMARPVGPLSVAP